MLLLDVLHSTCTAPRPSMSTPILGPPRNEHELRSSRLKGENGVCVFGVVLSGTSQLLQLKFDFEFIYLCARSTSKDDAFSCEGKGRKYDLLVVEERRE